MTKSNRQPSKFRADPFSAAGFAERAIQHGIALDKASWMSGQPISYGLDAGKLVDDRGEVIGGSRWEHTVPSPTWRTAAVLVPVIAREPEVTVLLTLRTSHLSSHGGQIAFPGGKVDEEDKTPVDAALREAEEEVGLPRSLATPLSLLDLHKTGTGYRIVPVLSLIDPAFKPQPAPDEVADIFEVPLSFLMTEQNHVEHFREWRSRRILFHAIAYEERLIWGATAAMIRNLFERLYAS